MRPNPVPTPADGESDLFRNRLDNLSTCDTNSYGFPG